VKVDSVARTEVGEIHHDVADGVNHCGPVSLGIAMDALLAFQKGVGQFANFFLNAKQRVVLDTAVPDNNK